MELTLQQAETVIDQVAQAHRIAVAFYQRLLPRIASVGDELGLDFWYWKPTETARPCRAATRPGNGNNWAWDMVPLFASTHVYRRVQGGGAAEGDAAVMFRFYVDTAIKPAERRKHGSGEPDALGLPTGRAVVEGYVARCTADSTQAFEAIWNAAPEPAAVAGWQKLGESLEAHGFSHEMAAFIAAPGDVVADIRRLLDQ